MPSPAIVADDQLIPILSQLGELRGELSAERRLRENLAVRLAEDNQSLDGRIRSAAEAASLASRECADLDRRVRDELAARVASLEYAHRTMRAVLGWVAGIVAALVVGVGVQAFRAWAGG